MTLSQRRQERAQGARNGESRIALRPQRVIDEAIAIYTVQRDVQYGARGAEREIARVLKALSKDRAHCIETLTSTAMGLPSPLLTASPWSLRCRLAGGPIAGASTRLRSVRS